MKVIVVDKNDKFSRLVDKNRTHKVKGILHRAFSVFVVNNKGEILLQKRSKYKKLWPLYWSNTCCSHPKKEEDYIKGGERRLKEEMGLREKLKPLFKFHYQAVYQDKGSENEMCTILIAKHNGQKIKVNKKEVADYRWLSLTQLKKEIKEKPEVFTPWLKKIIKDKRFKIK